MPEKIGLVFWQNIQYNINTNGKMHEEVQQMPGGQEYLNAIMSFAPLVIIIVLFYFLLILSAAQSATRRNARCATRLRWAMRFLRSAASLAVSVNIKDDVLIIESSN